MVEIIDIENNSIAENYGFLKGDILVSINDHEIVDVLDYSFYASESHLSVQIKRDGQYITIDIKKEKYRDLGLIFTSYLMDKKRTCKNNCIFCFIDQNPDGMRESIYFKDDDSRLSFLQGSYVTLTNMGEKDVERIVEMKTSPINISVHTTNPDLRCKMLNNRFAGKVLEYMNTLAKGKIQMNCQIVLCKGINDGDELLRTMNDLEKLYPFVNSVAIVPVGLTKFREGLFALEPFTKEDSENVIDMVEEYSSKMKKKHGVRLFYCSDEFYLHAKRPIHGESYYDGYPQLDNGVGLISSLVNEFNYALDGIKKEDIPNRIISIATGKDAYGTIKHLTMQLNKINPNFICNVYPITNNYYGHNITVTGLVTGTDIIDQLRGKYIGEALYLSCSMLKADEDLFLDGLTPQDIEKELKTKIVFCENDGEKLLNRIIKN